MDKKLDLIYNALQALADKVEAGKFGTGDDFDKHKFEAEFADEVLIIAYSW